MSAVPERRYSRRRFLRDASAAAVALGASTGVAAGASPDYGGWFTDSARGGATSNFDGTTVDKTGQDSVTIEVGAQGNGGPYGYAPPAVRVSPGTEVTFEWVSNTHDVQVESKPSGSSWEGVDSIKNEGYTHSHTFETAGVYKYYCTPHLSMGMKGAVVVGGSGAGGGGSPEWGDWFTDSGRGGAVGNYDGSTVDKTGQDSVTVEVGAQGNGGTYAYSPPALKISPGTEVTFEWTSNTHDIQIESAPSGSSWEGVDSIKNEGYTHSHTFETSGTYRYYCTPHLSMGMKGGIFVTGSAGGGGGGGGGLVPDLNWGNVAWMAGPSAVAVPAIVAYLLWDYGRAGAFDDLFERGESAEPPATTEAPPATPEREIDHDEYDPWGTALLLAVYFVIISVAWALMYFVEFLGTGPHIFG
ncbi:halocyanin domain-containing protein [Halarchaeum grantii]|uniref:halocyanin domain-containing protein n=1 Tax=Halarchaeum grantii TaxID=1193105 RepID=UPI001664B2F0|nr:halocyanin domain-containing protein [Halarchaeum grantii]